MRQGNVRVVVVIRYPSGSELELAKAKLAASGSGMEAVDESALSCDLVVRGLNI